MALQRMDNVLIVVEDLEAVKAFFAELGMEVEGSTTVEGPSVTAAQAQIAGAVKAVGRKR